MTNLGCNVDTCGYNKEHMCGRNNLVVGGCKAENKYDTCCTSFKELNSCSNACKSANSSLNVNCDAVNCIHNADHKCSADQITISGASASNSTQTICSSFSAK